MKPRYFLKIMWFLLLADDKQIEAFGRQCASSDRGGVPGKSLESKPR